MSPTPSNTLINGWADVLQHEGFLVVRDALTAHEVHALRAAFPPATDGATLHVEIDDIGAGRDRWLSLADHADIGALLDRLLDEYEVRIHGRDPGGGAGAQGLHADRPHGKLRDVDAVTVIWMLDDMTVDNGATRVVPRSHRGATAVPRHLAQPDVHHPDELIITGAAGDAIFFDAHLWHGGHRNLTRARRRVVQMTATHV